MTNEDFVDVDMTKSMEFSSSLMGSIGLGDGSDDDGRISSSFGSIISFVLMKS